MNTTNAITIQKLQPRHGKRPGRPMPYGTMETTHEEQERFREAMRQLLQGSKTIAMLEELMRVQPDMGGLY